MAVIGKYEGEITGKIDHIMFFLDVPGYDGYVDVVGATRDGMLPDGTLWTLWTLTVPAAEKERVPVAFETGEPRYETEGFSIAFDTLDELLDELRAQGYDEALEMEQDIVGFFS